jgi:hypothetical protein
MLGPAGKAVGTTNQLHLSSVGREMPDYGDINNFKMDGPAYWVGVEKIEQALLERETLTGGRGPADA